MSTQVSRTKLSSQPAVEIIGVTKFFWLTLDYQRVENPAYNADRGPVTIYGFRLHAEF